MFYCQHLILGDWRFNCLPLSFSLYLCETESLAASVWLILPELVFKIKVIKAIYAFHPLLPLILDENRLCISSGFDFEGGLFSGYRISWSLQTYASAPLLFSPPHENKSHIFIVFKKSVNQPQFREQNISTIRTPFWASQNFSLPLKNLHEILNFILKSNVLTSNQIGLAVKLPN